MSLSSFKGDVELNRCGRALGSAAFNCSLEAVESAVFVVGLDVFLSVMHSLQPL